MFLAISFSASSFSKNGCSGKIYVDDRYHCYETENVGEDDEVNHDDDLHYNNAYDKTSSLGRSPLSLLDFVHRAHRALKPCDPSRIRKNYNLLPQL